MQRLFNEAILMHGTPWKLRTDLGGENVDAWHHMLVRMRGVLLQEIQYIMKELKGYGRMYIDLY